MDYLSLNKIEIKKYIFNQINYVQLCLQLYLKQQLQKKCVLGLYKRY